MNFLAFLVESNIYLVIFFAFYRLALHKLTFHNAARIYLLLSTVISFILPLISFGNANVLSAGITPVLLPNPPAEPSGFSKVVLGVYLSVSFVLLVRLILTLLRLRTLIKFANKQTKVRRKHIIVGLTDEPFSFMNYIFLSADHKDNEITIRHESVHVDQLHSFDLLFLELVVVINWFNPVVYLLQKRVKAIHEFIADKSVISSNMEKSEYADFLLQHCRPQPFRHIGSALLDFSIMRERFIMLYSKGSRKSNLFWYFISLAPVLIIAITISFSGFNPSYKLKPHISVQAHSPEPSPYVSKLPRSYKERDGQGRTIIVQDVVIPPNPFTYR
jgi:hypothetical protein